MLAVLFGGVAADRIPQRRILLAVEIVRGSEVRGGRECSRHRASSRSGTSPCISFVLGVADGFFYPAYSAWLPAILPIEQLLAANGVEGVLRPAVMQAAGPALASALIAVQAPWLAFAVVAALQVAAAVVLVVMRTTAVRRDLDGSRASDAADVHRPARRVRLPAAHALAVRDTRVLDHARLRHHGADRGAASVRGERPDRRRCRGVRARARRRSASAARSGRSRWRRCASRVAT